MFTGIIKDIGLIRTLVRGENYRVEIATRLPMESVSHGDSIACAGVCLTVVDKTADSFFVDVSPETLRCTTLFNWSEGTRINLEAALRVGDALGGHFVSGHVDGLATILAISEQGTSRRIEVEAPASLARFIAAKGSVTLDGISLTVNEISRAIFSVMILDYTWNHTTLSSTKVDDKVNLEIDLLARYSARLSLSS